MPKKKTLAALKAAFKEADNNHSLMDQYQVLRTDAPEVKFSLNFKPNGLAAMSVAALGARYLLRDEIGKITNQVVGSGNAIRGKTLLVYTTLTVAGTAEDRPKSLFLDFSISGGKADYAHQLKQSIDDGATSILFEIEITFFTKSE